jgi:hypothetical protein
LNVYQTFKDSFPLHLFSKMLMTVAENAAIA